MYNWIKGGCARNKLNIGIPTYGRWVLTKKILKSLVSYLNILFNKKRSFSGDDPITSWGQFGGGSGGLTSKYIGESGVQTYYEVSLR
jgi:hypothetical protein